MSLPVIGLTMGDPVGIGPEIIVMALARKEVFACCRPLVFDDAIVLKEANRVLGSPCAVNPMGTTGEARGIPRIIDLIELSHIEMDEFRFGIPKKPHAGLAVEGLLASDSLFHVAASGIYDAVICMYHDQGLIPIKLMAFKRAVNVTLGLSIIRTSVHHGTAYDIARRGTADPWSLIEAIILASEMTEAQGKHVDKSV